MVCGKISAGRFHNLNNYCSLCKIMHIKLGKRWTHSFFEVFLRHIGEFLFQNVMLTVVPATPVDSFSKYESTERTSNKCMSSTCDLK